MGTGLAFAKRTDVSQLVTLDGTGDKFAFFAGTPTRITRVGFIQSIAATGTALVVKVDSDLHGASRGDGDVATITPAVAPAVNEGYYVELDEPFELKAGEGVIFEVTTAEDAGDGYMFVEHMPQPFVGTDVAKMHAVNS